MGDRIKAVSEVVSEKRDKVLVSIELGNNPIMVQKATDTP